MASESDLEAVGSSMGLEPVPKTPSQPDDAIMEDYKPTIYISTSNLHAKESGIARTNITTALTSAPVEDQQVGNNGYKNVYDSLYMPAQTTASLFLDDKNELPASMNLSTPQVSGMHEEAPAVYTVTSPTVIDRRAESVFATPNSEAFAHLQSDDDEAFNSISKKGSHVESPINNKLTLLPILSTASSTKTKQELNEDLLMDTDEDYSNQEYDIDEIASQKTDSDDSQYMEEGMDSDYAPSSPAEDGEIASIAQRRAAMQRISAKQTDDYEEDIDEAFTSINQLKYDMEIQVLRGFLVRREKLRSKQVSGHLTAAQQAQLQVLNDTIQSERKRLNIPEDMEITGSDGSFGVDTLPKDGSKAKATKIGQGTQGPRAKNAKEWFLKHGTDRRVLEGSKKRKQASPESSAASSAKRQKNSSSHPSRPGWEQIEGKEKLFGSLLNNNPIQAHHKWGNVSETEVKATKKRDQLQQLTDGAATGYADKTSDKRKLEVASRAFGYGKCVAQDGKWKLEGVKSPLLNHQVTGGAWLLRREFSQDGIHGGILADEMGMGKTLSMLSCIVSNQPTAEDLKRYSKGTLIIMPATAIRQWERQIELHVEKTHIKSILPFKMSMRLKEEIIKAADIIIASYNEIASEYPTEKFKNSLYKKIKDEKNDQEQYDEGLIQEQCKVKYKEALGPLFKIPFWRIVLDEAHAIKNKDSHTSIACRALKGRHRWAMTATPLQNSVNELFPYMNFIRMPEADSPQSFSKSVGKINSENALARLHEILPEFMLRRTSSDKFMGKPHLFLPKPHDDINYIDLTREEMSIYKEIEKCFREAINKAIKSGDTESNRINMLALITYLRMSTAHPFLLEGVLSGFLQKENIISVQKQLSEIGGRQPMVEQIGMQIGDLSRIITSTGSFGKSTFGSHFDMNKQLDIALAVQKEDVCRICLDIPTDPKLAECDHMFCTDCINGYIATTKKSKGGITKCPECDKRLIGLGLTKTHDEMFVIRDGDTDSATSSSTKSQRNRDTSFQQAMDAAYALPPSKMLHQDGRGIGHDVLNYHPNLKSSQMRFFHENDRKIPRESITPSAKTIAIKAIILQWLYEAPDDKIIIFSQFNKMSVIIGRMLQDERIPFLYFDGGLTPTRKQNAVDEFHNNPKIKVMISSLKCGGVALNLTCANRVIMSDLWWNISMEQQAFGRVFRYGQTKETYLRRIIAKNTIEQRVMDLQSKKSNEIKKAMENGTALDKCFSFEEKVRLFGRVVKDKKGNIRKVIADNDD